MACAAFQVATSLASFICFNVPLDAVSGFHVAHFYLLTPRHIYIKNRRQQKDGEHAEHESFLRYHCACCSAVDLVSILNLLFAFVSLMAFAVSFIVAVGGDADLDLFLSSVLLLCLTTSVLDDLFISVFSRIGLRLRRWSLRLEELERRDICCYFNFL